MSLPLILKKGFEYYGEYDSHTCWGMCPVTYNLLRYSECVKPLNCIFWQQQGRYCGLEHPKQASQQQLAPGTDLEPAGEEEESPSSQQLETRIGGAEEAAGVQLGEGSKNGPGQDGMADSRR